MNVTQIKSGQILRQALKYLLTKKDFHDIMFLKVSKISLISISWNIFEVVSKIILINKINQIEFAIIYVAISKCQIKKNKDVYGFTGKIHNFNNKEK
jgi:hypothetical protein